MRYVELKSWSEGRFRELEKLDDEDLLIESDNSRL